MFNFSGIWIPLVTPFSANGAVDHDALRRLIRLYADAGVAGVVALGTTGEPSSLEPGEQEAVLATTLDAADGALPVIVGVSGNNARAVRERVLRLNALPLAGVLISAPYYVRPSQAGIAAHFTMLADASEHPVVMYDIPARTGVRIELATLLSLAAHPRIQAIKDCAGSLDTTLALILDGRLQVLAGDDIRIFDTLCMGGSGAIAASAHVWPERFVALDRALKAGRLDEGRALFHSLVPLIGALTAESNPAPVKAALAVQGLMEGDLRAPMTQASEMLRERLQQLLAA
ncbi:4-hydroxy-tetrahydrodipicolinate synthase [Paraburkholderia terrae]|uniref:4-hydroxy-tetrahydrodipicolinate synthase n=1 Tax=Paraburkholderia terrae TaxID=311230 RepID=A0ABM7TNE1_9BURK|nr:4-hydroxy-tetrahydrodipicolinate synthase [Paraburkholderia terrae]BCZ79828.1 4-hydroxy-tetrahydrodipicolinate synthase [Paraburkholderia terrae]BDC41705.1 4-hydroxy-tetrahydrodipicolinate synthase [Paraburkholderia terrae]